jgi:hypothetical protein
LANPGQNPEWVLDLSLKTAEAMASRSSVRVLKTACAAGAEYAVVPWPDPSAVYSDKEFSILRVPESAALK